MAKIALLLHDEPTRQALSALLSCANHESRSLAAMDSASIDLIVAELSAQPLRELLSRHPSTPIIILAGASDVAAAIDAMKLGATDFVLQPLRGDELLVRITRALELAQIFRENQTLRSRVPTEALAGQPLAEVEKKIIISTLQQFRGHRVKTASALGIGVRTLGMKLKRWRQEGELVEV